MLPDWSLRACSFDLSSLFQGTSRAKPACVVEKNAEDATLSTGIRPQLHFPLLHAVGCSTAIMSWSVCAALLANGRFASSPWLIASFLSSGIATKGCAAALTDLQQVSNDDSRKMTVLFLMYACLCLIPCPFFLLYPGVALPIRVGIPAVVGFCTLFEVWYPAIMNVDESLALKSLRMAKTEANTAWAQLPAGSWNLIKRYFEDTDGKGSTFALTCLAATGFALGLDFVGNQWRGMFFDAIQKKSRTKFVSLLRDFVFLAAAAVLGGSYSAYITSMWDLHWRQYLTRDMLSRWFRYQAYFKLSQDMIDNCDQRICEDVRGFVSLTRGLGLGSLSSIGRLAIFLPQLIISAPAGLWQLCLLASVTSSIMTHYIGQPLIPNNVAIQATEANFRSSLMAVRDEAEHIVLMGSEKRENANCLQRFEELKAALWSSMQVSFRLSAFTSGYSMGQTVFPFILLSPFYFSGQISMGTMFLLEGVMGNVQQGLDFFIVSYGELAQWRATSDRLLHLENSTNSIVGPELPSGTASFEVHIRQLRAGEKILLSDCRVSIQEGDRLIITGEQGKSTLLKALALIHPCDATWEARPAAEDILFVPQRVVIPNEPMTLRQLLAFPCDETVLTDVEDAMSTVGLTAWMENMDKVNRWARALSTDEVHRIAFARLLCTPLPKWVFLDDPVSRFPPEQAVVMFDALFFRLHANQTVVTITLQPGALRHFHSRFLEVANNRLIEREKR